MAPLDPEYHNSNTLVGFVISTYVLTITVSLLLIGRTLIRAYYGHPIYLRTRSHDPLRRYDVLTSIALTALSFGLNAYHVVDALVTSYRAWAANINLLLPTNIWTASAWFPFAEKSDELRLGAWFKETDWLREISFAVAGRSRDFWWAQQLSSATMIWSIFLAIEARRRNIPHAWTFIVLAHLVGLSTAQNLFHIVLLLTPLPIEKSTGKSAIRLKLRGSSKPITWTPRPIVFLVPLIAAMLSTGMFPYMSSNATLFTCAAVPVVLTFVPVILTTSKLIPTSWGRTHPTIERAHSSSLPVFSTSARLSTTIHVLLTVTSLFFNTPPARSQDPATLLWSKFLSATNLNSVLASSTITTLTSTQRARIAITRLLNSMSDNPVVRKIGWDVLLSALSLCVWAGFRGLDANHMLSAAGVPGIKDISSLATDLSATIAETTSSTIDTLATSTADLRTTASKYTDPALESLTETAKNVSKQVSDSANAAKASVTAKAHELADAAIARLGVDDDSADDDEDETPASGRLYDSAGIAATKRAATAVSSVASAAVDAIANASPVKRAGRGRPAKDAAATATSSIKSVASQARRRVAAATADSKKTSSTLPGKRTKSRSVNTKTENDDDEYDSAEDEDYTPLKNSDSTEYEHEREKPATAASGEDAAEGVALAWGLAVFGGLGTAGAGVWGADLVVR